MVTFTEIGEKFDDIKKNLIELNNKSIFEKTALYSILCVYMMLIPIVGFIFMSSVSGWNGVFDMQNAGYLMAALLIIFPYLGNLVSTFFTALLDPGKYLQDPTVDDLRYVLKLDTNNPTSLFKRCMFNVMGAATFAMLVPMTLIPQVAESSMLLQFAILVCILFIWISLLLWLMTFIYIMKYAMFGPINDANHPKILPL